ncbi:MAG TPA: DUF4149 domain-containing protein [Candidatus Acidoferrales bacterium]|nr:DUF4149 domain-containing protein [Candidatus Acidoferrales bacterium]
MTNVLRFLKLFALGTWIGGIIFLSFVEAPGVFGILSNLDRAGSVVGYSLTRLHYIGIAAAVVYLAAGFGLEAGQRWVTAPAAILVLVMLGLTLVSQYGVRPKMDRLQAQMVSIQATAMTNPLRVQFEHLHRASVWLEGGTLVIGIAALFLTTRQKTEVSV